MFLSYSSWILRSDRIINKESLLRLLFLKPFSDPTCTYLFWTVAGRTACPPIYLQGRDERHNRVDSLFFFCVSTWKYCDLRHVQKRNPHNFSSMFLMRGMWWVAASCIVQILPFLASFRFRYSQEVSTTPAGFLVLASKPVRTYP